MFKRGGIFVFGVKIAFALATIFISTGTANPAERNLRVSYSAPATAFLPLWAAKEAGIFRAKQSQRRAALCRFVADRVVGVAQRRA